MKKEVRINPKRLQAWLNKITKVKKQKIKVKIVERKVSDVKWY